MKKYTLLTAILLLVSLSVTAQTKLFQGRDSLLQYFREYDVTGSFSYYNFKTNETFTTDTGDFRTPSLPASTFKICNTLIGLETGVISGEEFALPWDSVVRPLAAWNKSLTLQEAFRVSSVWFYQEIARRIGEKKMKQWLLAFDYGNQDITDGVDQFWLTGRLKISPEQQIAFLKKLFEGSLPCSKRSQDIVKRIMIAKSSPFDTLRAKTGWGEEDNFDIGWYIGYETTPSNVYIFATRIRAQTPAAETFPKARISISRKCIDKVRDKGTFCVVADPQLGMDANNQSDSLELNRLSEVIGLINEQSPDVVLVCGDLVNQTGDPVQITHYLDAWQTLDRNFRLVHLPGNHDVGNIPSNETVKAWRLLFGPDYGSFLYKGKAFIYLDTPLFNDSLNHYKDNKLQEDWLFNTLAGYNNQHIPVFVFQHQPWFINDTAETGSYQNLPRTARNRVLPLMQRCGVTHVFSGHHHCQLRNQYKDIQLITLNSIGKSLCEEPRSYLMVMFDEDGVYWRFLPLP